MLKSTLSLLSLLPTFALCSSEKVDAQTIDKQLPDLTWKTSKDRGSNIIPHITMDNDGYALSLSADLLYMFASQDGAIVAVDDTKPLGKINRGKELFAKCHFEPGFRVAAKYTSDFDLFDVQIKFTRFNSYNDHKKYSGYSISELIPIWSLPAFTPSLSDLLDIVEYNWTVKSHFIDLELGREYKPLDVEWLSLRPFFGMRYYRVEQKLIVAHTRQNIAERDDTATKSNYRGFGGRLGIELHFALKKWCTLYSNYAASFVAGRNDQRFKERQEPKLPNLPYAHAEADPITPRRMFEFGTGIQLEKMWRRDTLGTSLRLGWESIMMPNHVFYTAHYSKLLPLASLKNQGDLSYHGFTISGTLDF